jgi:putative ABC transport system permease protein
MNLWHPDALGGFRFHLRLAIISLRRDRSVTIAAVLCLALGAGIWTMVLTHYFRTYPLPPAVPATLHTVEINHPRALALADGAGVDRNDWQARTRVTFPEYELLSASGIPSRQTGTYRSRLVIAADETTRAQIINTRFVGPDFFGLFDVRLGAGRLFTHDEEAAGAAVAVVGRRYAEAHFGSVAAAADHTLLVEGRRFKVVGALAADQPERPAWDIVLSARDQDAIYLPFPWGRRLAAQPFSALPQSPLGTQGDTDAIWRSDALFVTYWLELPDARQREAYASYLARTFGPRGQPYWLRSFAAWRPLFSKRTSEMDFYVLLSALGLAGAAFSVSRLLLAKGLARRGELAIYRALGATRATLFWTQMLEAALLAIPATAIGIASAGAQHAFYNRFAAENDMPVALDTPVVLIGVATAIAVSLLAAIYPAWRASRTPPTVYLGRL